MENFTIEDAEIVKYGLMGLAMGCAGLIMSIGVRRLLDAINAFSRAS